MWKIVIFKQVDFFTMLFLRELVVKNLKVLFYCNVLFLKVLLYALYLKLILSKGFKDLLCLDTRSLNAERVFNWIFFEEVKNFCPLNVKLFVNQKVKLIPILHQIFQLCAFIHEIWEGVNKFNMEFNLLNDSHILLYVGYLWAHFSDGLGLLELLNIYFLSRLLKLT